MTSATYPNNEVLTYAYNAAWRATSMCTSLGGCYVTQTQYTINNQRLSQSQMTLGNGVKQTSNFGGLLQQLQQIQVGPVATPGSLFDRSYTYDLGGNIKTIINNVSGQNQTQNYNYDHRDRLTRAWTTGGTGGYDETYAYDTIGNITSKGPTSGGATSYTYPTAGQPRPHAPTSVGGQSYSYDNNGNLSSGGNRSYNWNVDNQPTSVTGPDSVQETYTYDAMGERLSRTRSGVTTVYLGLWEEETSGTKRAQYKFGGQVIAQRDVNAGTVTYIHGDHLGSASLATNGTTGALVSQQEFDSWGKVRSGGVGQTTINYTGQKLDGTGLLYYHARMYDPGLAKFVNADSIVPGAGDPQSFNRYSYVRNNPLGKVDPTGHCDGTPENRGSDTDCWTAYDAAIKRLGYEPLGLAGWGWDRLTQLVWWLDHGVVFTNNNVNINGINYIGGTRWTADEIWDVIDALGKSYNFLTKPIKEGGLYGFTMTEALAAMGITYNGDGTKIETTLTFNKYDDPDRNTTTSGAIAEDRRNQINVQHKGGPGRKLTYEIVHEIGHIIDRSAGVVKGYPRYWSQGADEVGIPNWGPAPGNYEDFANKFRDLVYGDAITDDERAGLSAALNVAKTRKR